MIINRNITEDDRSLLELSLKYDEYHKDTPTSFFYEEGTVCSVYEDETGPICFVRGKPIVYETIKIIQIDIQYLDNKDARRNLKAMLDGFPPLAERALENGFSGFFFVSTAPLLRKFCIKRLGFEPWGDEFLVKVLQENDARIY
jgi:hypothetical protein